MSNDRARRNELRQLQSNPQTHAGLWLDRFLTIQTKGDSGTQAAQTAKTDLIHEVTQIIRVPEGYRDAFERRALTLGTPQPGKKVFFAVFRTLGRLAVGLGQSGVLENGLSLDHTWGIPILPGSALKGVAAAAAHKLTEDPAWRKETAHEGLGESAAYLFGTTEKRGAVDFFDAWWIPDDRSSALYQDTMTAHNRTYYQNNKDNEPQGMDSPIPVTFISASGSFLIAAESSAQDADDGWLDAAIDLLTLGLKHLGVGAKTNAGYGHMEQDDEATGEYSLKIDKAQKLQSLMTQALSEKLSEAITSTLGSKTAAKKFADMINKLTDDQPLHLQDIFTSKEVQAALPQGEDGSLANSKVREELKQALLSCEFIEDWSRGETGANELSSSTNKNRLIKLAEWAGYQQDVPKAPEPPTSSAASTSSALIAKYPAAATLAPAELQALERCMGDDGQLQEEAILELMDEVGAWSPQAKAIFNKLLDQL